MIKNNKRRLANGLTNALFLAPMVIPFVFTVLIPFAVGVFFSLTDWNGVRYNKFMGLGNYITIFTQNDYQYSLFITIVFTVVNMLTVNILAFALALVCSKSDPISKICRAAFFIPNLIGGIVLGYVWQFIFNRVFVLVFQPSMLTVPNLAVLSIVIVSSWQYAGYIMMIYITGLQLIPKEVLEAAQIDGAGVFRTMFKIKIPMIANTTTICLFLTLVNSFKQFDLNFAITGGAPARLLGSRAVPSTEFLALNIYNTAIARNNYALGQSKAVMFFIVLTIISLTQVWINKKREIEM